MLLAPSVLLTAALLVNMAIVDRQHRPARLTMPNAQLVETSIGTLQVLDEGNLAGSPIVLIHGFACSMRWFDKLAPLLSAEHRIIRVDLLGHGGSDQPATGYSIENHARAITEIMAKLGVPSATIVGHSLGGAVTTALVQSRPELVDKAVIIASTADPRRSAISIVGRLSYTPVIGQAIRAHVPIVPGSWVRGAYCQAFAPGFRLTGGFDDPDGVIEDACAMTHAAYVGNWDAYVSYGRAQPLDARLAGTATPLLLLFGDRDQMKADARADLRDFRRLPQAKVVVLPEIGHSPQIEAPQETSKLIRGFIPRSAVR